MKLQGAIIEDKLKGIPCIELKLVRNTTFLFATLKNLLFKRKESTIFK